MEPHATPTEPAGASLDDAKRERHERVTKLAGALRIFGALGFGEGVAGHITVRDPILTDHFWVNPFGKSFRHMRVEDLLLVAHDGQITHGDGLLNRAAFVLHAAIHQARPEINAAAHAHSTYGKAFSALGIQLAPITQDACAFYNDHTVIAEHGGAVVLDIDAGRDFARLFPTGKAAIHQNHGLFTVGHTVDEAAWWFVTMERSCQVQLAAMAAGQPIAIRDEYARHTFEHTGTPQAGWFNFQPLWQDLLARDEDFTI